MTADRSFLQDFKQNDYGYDWIVENAEIVVDTRNATAAARPDARKIVKA
ncbi:MAG: hypothetical protein KAY65_04480 [Planctomycetes bacterium]|nr:hypothetical protein [Planctomycetota bacterium]